MYVRRKGFDDPVLLKFAIGFIALWEVNLSPTMCYFYLRSFELTSGRLTHDMCKGLRNVEPDIFDVYLENNTRLAIWVEVFKLHWILRG